MKNYKSLQEFLEDRSVNWKLFLENCKPENQKWKTNNESRTYDIPPEEKFYEDKENFLFNCFSWQRSLQKGVGWNRIDFEFEKFLEINPKVKFGKTKDFKISKKKSKMF